METERARKKILVIDDENTFRLFLEETLRNAGMVPLTFGNPLEALPHVVRGAFDLVLTDLRMPGMSGMELIRAVRAIDREIPIVMMSAHGSVEDAMEAIREGANDYLTKPFLSAEFLFRLRMALRAASQTKEIERLSRDLGAVRDLDGMVGRSKPMLAVFDRVRAVADTDATVLIRGETGTGKELIAQAIHRLGARRAKPFVSVNCAAIPETLFESEVFGHERGAFTGAHERKAGKVESAEKGTLLLDEVGDLPLAAQAKMLRVLQTRTVERLGSNKPLQVDVRILAATHRDLVKRVGEGAFREDLFYRLNVVEIEIPPLRERTEDIAVLAETMVRRFASAHGRGVTGISPSVMREMLGHPWPGNVRQLEHVVERAVILAKGNVVDSVELPAPPTGKTAGGRAGARIDLGAPLKDLLERATTEIEREYVSALLDACGGRVGVAAERSGLNRKSFYSKMKQYGLRKEDYKDDE